MAEHVMIKVEHVSKAFKLPHEKQTSLKGALINFRKRGFETQQVLQNVSFEIKQGEFIGIVGRNGSGKSTLLKLLAGIYTPDEGSVTINGKLTPFIELGVGFNPELSGRENVFLNGALLGFTRKEMTEMYDDIVKFAELERFMDQKLKNYSSGMQVRLAFSIAIRAKSDILLIDEVLAVGDESFQRKCMEYFVKLKRAKQTVVFVSHDMSQVSRFCDRAIYIEEGSKLTEGTPPEIAELYTKKNLAIDTSKQAEKGAKPQGKELNLKVDFVKGNRIEAQNNLHLKISWNKHKSVQHVGIAIIKDTGEYVFGTNTILDGIAIKGSPVEYIVNCNLVPSKYTLAVGLFGDSDADIITYNPSQAEFIVDPKHGAPQRAGITDLKHEWR